MREPRYSVSEIERMRRAIWDLRTVNEGSYSPSAMSVRVEAELQTYMHNGTTPEELELAEIEHRRRTTIRVIEE